MPYRFLYSQKHFLQDILMKSLLISFFMVSKYGIWIFFLLLSSTLLEMLKVWFMLLQLHVTLWFMKNLNVEYPQPEIRNFILKLLWNESAIGLLGYDVNQYGWGRVEPMSTLTYVWLFAWITQYVVFSYLFFRPLLHLPKC